MATMALPIRELEPVRIQAEKAQAETECVVICSKSKTESASLRVVWQIAWKTLALRRRLSNLTMRQSRLIGMLVACDFNNGNAQDLENLASLIDGMVSDEREILKLACALGAEIRNWWSTSLLLLSEQTEHLDSIAESLHLAADPRGTALMAMAVEEFTAANQLATQ